MKHRFRIAIAALCWVTSVTANAQEPREPHTYFRDHAGLTDGEIRAIDAGEVIVKLVDTGEKPEVLVFGAVYIRAPIESFAKWFQDPSRFTGTDAYLGYGRLSEPPTPSDVTELSLDEDDVKALRKCKRGDCPVQLPAESMERFQREVDWSAPDASAQAQALVREGVLRLVERYKTGGNPELSVYQDKDYDLAVDQTFETIVGRIAGLAAYLPELERYLLDYPKATLPNVDESFHWEHVKFGLKPTLRVNHVTTYRPPARDGSFAIVDKQLYASHYFQVAVDFWVCVKDSANPDAGGFYLITAKGSRQHGLTGFRGAIIRGPMVNRARGSLENALGAIKQELESRAR